MRRHRLRRPMSDVVHPRQRAGEESSRRIGGNQAQWSIIAIDSGDGGGQHIGWRGPNRFCGSAHSDGCHDVSPQRCRNARNQPIFLRKRRRRTVHRNVFRTSSDHLCHRFSSDARRASAEFSVAAFWDHTGTSSFGAASVRSRPGLTRCAPVSAAPQEVRAPGAA